ncbi:unnamed protein product [Allacma fusca]|uniref:non-specific serine/threonine protein kinase n=3 Tax=Allacma fusca TaxID=39272 RepID=A0A8J2M7U9_9HEXA|nr:unnamed protein product [Allacma fusca]
MRPSYTRRPSSRESSSSSSSSDSEKESCKIYGTDDDEQEDPRDYKKGGYHPVKIGDVFNQRYEVIRKLGWGHFSTVWLCWDRRAKTYVAVKVVKSGETYTDTAVDEIKILKSVRDADKADLNREKLVQLLDDFKVTGVNGVHVCMVFEVLGTNLWRLILKTNNEGIPIPNVKTIIKQVLEALDYLHSKCKIIHTDIKPENIMICADADDVTALAEEARSWQRLGIPPPVSSVSTAPYKPKPLQKEALSKNKKKKLKKKAKKAAAAPGTSNRASSKATAGTTAATTSVGNKSRNSSVRTTSSKPPSVVKIKTAPKSLEASSNSNSNSIEESPTSPEDTSEKTSESNGEIGAERGDPPTTIGGGGDETTKDAENPSVPDSGTNILSKPDPTTHVCDISVKLADLGNACWVKSHYTDDIQTRQYRCLEVLLGANYGTPSDIWSVACLAFELATGDFLFDPHKDSDYDRDEDHIAHIIELLGPIPKKIAFSGKYSMDFFNRKKELRNIKTLKFWPLPEVLKEKYDWSDEDAKEFSEFILPMLHYNPLRRASAAQCLAHPWLNREEPT